MTEKEFCFWLQGFYEILGGAPALTEAQSKMIKDHLGYVFEHRQLAQQVVTATQFPKMDVVKRDPNTIMIC